MKRFLKNPFLLTGYYGKEYFCNREIELSKLQQHIDNERNVVLYSWRRLGKTALIHCFLNELEQQKQTETLYIDLLNTRNTDEVVLQITRAVFQKYGKTKSGISAAVMKLLGAVGVELTFNPLLAMPVLQFSFSNQTDIVPQSLEAIGKFLQSRSKTIVIALDEFQQLNHYEHQNGEAVMRTWMQQFPDIRFIFSGSHRNMMQAMFMEKNRPFYKSASMLPLSPIKLSEYQEFIQNHFNKADKSIDASIIAEIYEWSRQQTYSVQLICNKLYGNVKEVTKEDLQTVQYEILQEEAGVFANYTRLLTQAQWKLLLAIAKEEPLQSPTAKEFLRKYDLGAASTVSSALQKLMDVELVIKENNYYMIHDIILARWLQTI